MKIVVVAFTTTLMLAEASHAADKIALICFDAKGNLGGVPNGPSTPIQQAIGSGVSGT